LGFQVQAELLRLTKKKQQQARQQQQSAAKANQLQALVAATAGAWDRVVDHDDDDEPDLPPPTLPPASLPPPGAAQRKRPREGGVPAGARKKAAQGPTASPPMPWVSPASVPAVKILSSIMAGEGQQAVAAAGQQGTSPLEPPPNGEHHRLQKTVIAGRRFHTDGAVLQTHRGAHGLRRKTRRRRVV